MIIWWTVELISEILSTSPAAAPPHHQCRQQWLCDAHHTDHVLVSSFRHVALIWHQLEQPSTHCCCYLDQHEHSHYCHQLCYYSPCFLHFPPRLLQTLQEEQIKTRIKTVKISVIRAQQWSEHWRTVQTWWCWCWGEEKDKTKGRWENTQNMNDVALKVRERKTIAKPERQRNQPAGNTFF